MNPVLFLTTLFLAASILFSYGDYDLPVVQSPFDTRESASDREFVDLPLIDQRVKKNTLLISAGVMAGTAVLLIVPWGIYWYTNKRRKEPAADKIVEPRSDLQETERPKSTQPGPKARKKITHITLDLPDDSSQTRGTRDSEKSDEP